MNLLLRYSPITVLAASLLLLTPPTLQAQTTYKIDAKASSVIYAMSHAAHDWEGTSKSASGKVVLGADTMPQRIEVKIPVLSFDSGNRNRDSNMAETVEFYLFPDVVFTSNTITPVDSVSAADSSAGTSWRIEGTLTFHGVTKPVTSVAAITRTNDGLTAEGAFEVKITDFDIKPPSLLMVKVKDWIKLTYTFTAKP